MIHKKEIIKNIKKPKIIVLIILLIIALIGIIFTSYYVIKYSFACKDNSCFLNRLVKCQITTYISQKTETTIEYDILGEKNLKCEVNVKLLQVKEGSIELASLQGKEMKCYLPLNTYVEPEKNIKDCSGELKEQMQEIMIQRMHSQISENIGAISKEATKIL